MLVVIPLVALALGFTWWLSSGRYVSTDNAYVGADKSMITPQVTGAIVAVHVVEGQKVKVGDPLFDIDPKPYQIALALAKGKLEAAKVEFANLQSSYVSNIDQIKMGEDAVRVRQADFDRKNELATSRSGTAADRDTSMANLIQAKQILEFVKWQQDTVKVKLGGGPNTTIDQFPDYMQAQAAVDDAERNLRNTKVLAPIDGVATQVPEIELGRVAAAGQPVFAVVADTGLWVDANPKESDLTYVHVGLPATVSVDTFPDREWKGTICSIAPGTGAQFAILPPQNASGNWVKVVQRVPLRFCFDPKEDTTGLRAGMSTYLTVDTGRVRTLAGTLEGLKQWVGRLRRHPPGGEDRRHPMNAQAPAPPLYETISPTLKWLLTVCIMMATIMQALDTTIANVALPYMQGSLATTQDQINWVLTSYIVAAAIMTSPLGWMATRFGRKKLFIVCTAGFTVASMLCGIALYNRADGRLPAAAGRVRRGARAVEPGGDARHLPARQARLGDGDLGHGRHARPDHGPDARRLAHRLVFVALGVLRQSAIRHPHHLGSLGLHERDADAARRALLLVRLLEPVARHRLLADDARPRRAARLVRIARNHH